MQISKTFTIVIPCYNEEQAISHFESECVHFVENFQREVPSFELQIVIVDNNSNDNSVALLKKIIQDRTQLKIHLIECASQGYGAALKAGFRHIHSDYYGFTDLDGTYPLVEFFKLLQCIDQFDLDIISTQRFSAQTGMPLIRKIGNKFYSLLVHLLFQTRLEDVCSGMRIFHHRIKDQVLNINENGLDFSIALTALMLRKRWVYQMQLIKYKERWGSSKLSVISDGIGFLKTLLKYKWKSV